VAVEAGISGRSCTRINHRPRGQAHAHTHTQGKGHRSHGEINACMHTLEQLLYMGHWKMNLNNSPFKGASGKSIERQWSQAMKDTYIHIYIYVYIRAVSVNVLIYAINLAAFTH